MTQYCKLENSGLENVVGVKTADRLCGRVEPTDKVLYKGHLTLVSRPTDLGKNFDVVVSKNAAVIMYIDNNDDVYFVKQFRPAVGKELLELPAETLDKPGKTSLQVIVEGLEEECGIKIDESQVKYFATVGSSEGHDTEYVDLFCAKGPNVVTKQKLGENERIIVHKIPFYTAYNMIATGEIQCSKGIILLQNEYIERLKKGV